MGKKYWLFIEPLGGSKMPYEGFIQVDEKKLDFHCPNLRATDKAKFIYRKNKTKDRWVYAHYGETKEECWLRATYYYRLKIEKLQKELKEETKELFEKYGSRPSDFVDW